MSFLSIMGILAVLCGIGTFLMTLPVAIFCDPFDQPQDLERDAKQAKQMDDRAHAAEIYARRQKLSKEAMAYAHSIKIDALTKAGESMKLVPKPTGGDAQRTRLRRGTESSPTLEQAGFTKKRSAESQFLAELQEAQPELHEAILEKD
jgi:hypothetical protein